MAYSVWQFRTDIELKYFDAVRIFRHKIDREFNCQTALRCLLFTTIHSFPSYTTKVLLITSKTPYTEFSSLSANLHAYFASVETRMPNTLHGIQYKVVVRPCGNIALSQQTKFVNWIFFVKSLFCSLLLRYQNLFWVICFSN